MSKSDRAFAEALMSAREKGIKAKAPVAPISKKPKAQLKKGIPMAKGFKMKGKGYG